LISSASKSAAAVLPLFLAALCHAAELPDARLKAYLRQTYPCEIARVAVGERNIRIEGKATGDADGLFVAQVPVHLNAYEATDFPFVETIRPAEGGFTVDVERHRPGDRLLAGWAIVRKTAGGYELQSHARWPDAVNSRWELPHPRPSSKKGLGGFHAGRLDSDLDELGIAAVTVNVSLNGIMRSAPASGRMPFEYAGRTWHVEDRSVERLDRTLRAAAKRNLLVSAITLINQAGQSPQSEWARLATHPDAHPSGTYVMPNVTTAEGVNAYAAALEFLARRYSGPHAPGRIHHWIMHNEVDAGWVWTNAGEKTAAQYMDLYHKSMRIAHLIARQYDPHARAFISLTHHWAKPGEPRFHAARDMLDLLLDFSRAEGDFEWALAHHPYPQDLFNPRVWEDDHANHSFDTHKITFKNIEVLDAWVRQPRAMYLGKHRRTVHLSEQGLNSRDYSAKSLADQAAGMAYAWNKIKHLDSIEMFHYHNWMDHPAEGGLRIGLRKFPADREDPMGAKPVWHVYKALATPNEDAATAFAKLIVGVGDWAEIRVTTAPKR
jgi:hypothetical protein